MRRMNSRIATAAVLVLLAGGCDGITRLDNRRPPESRLTGRVLYNGEPVGLRSGAVEAELWQEGYELNQKIPVYLDQEGAFAAMLFDGRYKLNLLPNSGPWVNAPDTARFELRGSVHMDLQVTPYYLVRDVAYARGAPTEANPGGTLSARFRVQQVSPARDLEYVRLFVGHTQFVDHINNIPVSGQQQLPLSAVRSAMEAGDEISLEVSLPATIYQTNSPWRREFVFVRVGVKTVGVPELMFSPVYELAL